MFYGVRHGTSYCINASRGLSAKAEFLVLLGGMKIMHCKIAFKNAPYRSCDNVSGKPLIKLHIFTRYNNFAATYALRNYMN